MDWGFPALALLAVVVVMIVASDRLSLALVEVVALAGWAVLVAWTASSALWSTVAAPLVEAERTTLYLAAVAACLLGGGRLSARPLTAALLVAVTTVSCWSLVPRLLHPTASAGVGAGRLAGPVGYWNGLGLMAAIGCLLALGFAIHGDRVAVRALASATLVVLVPTLYFTFSRGSWLALVVGLLVALAVEPKQWQLVSALLSVVPAAALAFVLAAHAHALGTTGESPVSAAATHEGHVLAVELLALSVSAAALAVAVARLPQPRPLPARLRAPLRMTAATLAVSALAVVIVVSDPAARAHHLLASFRAQPAGGSSDLGGRLFSTSGNGRSAYWSVAWREVRMHPLLGGGAGSYERYWLHWRPVPAPTLDAHELYLETLAELGPVGAVALLVALLAPFALLRRARREPLAAACAGAYVAFLVHAALDWDWELTAVGLTGVLCGVSLLLASRGTGQERRLGQRGAFAIVASTVALGAIVFVLHVGNSASAASEAAAARDDNRAAARDARSAERWAPWSAQAHRDLGEALLAEGDTGDAAAALQRGIAEDAGDWQLWYDLALASRGRGRAAALARAAALDPLSPDIAQATSTPTR